MIASRRSVLSTRYFNSFAKRIMEKQGVVPDAIDVVPKQVLQINYPSGVKVEEGKELTPTQVKDVPTLKWETDKSSLYTLSMIDLDPPSRKEPTFREWNHWLVGNIPGNDVQKGEVLADYIGSGPPKDSGLHRYVFLVYKQNGRLTFDEKKLSKTSVDDRRCFSVRKFAAKYNLGQPIAGNFYQAEYDDYVPILYKQIGF